MHEDRTVLVEDTDIHGPGMQVDATVKLVLFRVESHEVSFSFVSERFPSASIPLGYAEGEASIIINHMHRSARSKFLILLPMPFARPVMWSVRHPSHRWFHQQAEGVIYLCHTSTCKHGQGRYETAGERAG